MRSPHESKRDLVLQWVRKAEKDFDLAKHLIDEGCFYCEAVGFNSQQAAEKFLKALLVLHQVDFPKTHSIGELLDLAVGIDPVLAGSLREVTALNPYGVEYRYPSDFPEMTKEDAEAAFRLAEKVRATILPKLPSPI